MLSLRPISSVSLKSFAYCALVKAGGPAGRKADADPITHGVIEEKCGYPAPFGSTAGLGYGSDGAGRRCPTVVNPTQVGAASAKPSPERHVQIASATVVPSRVQS